MNKTDEILARYSNPLPQKKPGEKAAVYFVEIMSECNLKCPLCAFGSREHFNRESGIMDLNLFEKIIEKISKESPTATVSPYHHCEPILHPQLPEMIAIIKKYGLVATISCNFNKVSRLEDLVKAGPDFIQISVSGYYQDTYARHHVGGDIEKVKENILLLKKIIEENDGKISIGINYHMYRDNIGDDFDKMLEFCMENGFRFDPSWARSINLEMSLKYLRENNFCRFRGKEDWLDKVEPLGEKFYSLLNSTVCFPEDYLEGKWSDICGDVCPTNERITNIRWNGKLSMCCAGFDDRLTTNLEYLECDLEELYRIKQQSNFCRECVQNNYAFYMNYVDVDEMNRNAFLRLEGEIPLDRRMYFDFDSILEEVKEFSMAHSKVYIMGAGRYGRKLANALHRNNIPFAGFAVSKKENDCDDIIELDDLIESKDTGIGIVTALNEINLSQVYKKLDASTLDVLFVAPSRYSH